MCARSNLGQTMTADNLLVQSQVEQWKTQNADRLISCRWGLRITKGACHAYQTRTARYVLHFNGDRNPALRVNADYLRCLLPEPCGHLLPDSECEGLAEDRPGGDDNGQPRRLIAQIKARTLDRLVNPDRMLNEPDRHRSLVKG